MSEPDFSEAAVLEAARRAAGLSDFGDEGFREGLRVLLETYDKTADFHEQGRRAKWRRVVQLLSTRLRIEETFRQHPEIHDRRIRRPLILTGLPRTGTSALFNLLAVDPAARPLLLWEGTFPDPAQGLAAGEPDPRQEAVRAHFKQMREKNPEFTKIHFADADTPEECVLLLAHDFCDVQLGIEPLMEPYASWFQKQDLRRPYAYYIGLLKMLDWQRPGERWLLKSPAHLWALDILVERLPDVCIVLTHRNPLESVSSYCSMMAALMAERRSLDRKALGPLVLEYLARSLETGLAARERSDSSRFFDIDYRRFVRDPLDTVQSLYHHFGLELSPATRTAMQQHLEANPRGRHGAHSYTLEEFGLSPQKIRSRLGAYIERYELPTE